MGAFGRALSAYRCRRGRALPAEPDGGRVRRRVGLARRAVTGGMASDGDLLLAAFEAGRAAVFKVFGELADGSQLRSISKPNARR